MSHSWFNPEVEKLEAKYDWSILPDPQIAQLQQGAITSINATLIDQSTWSFGTRWDVTEHVSLKAQVDLVHIEDTGHGLWATQLLHAKPDTRVQVYSLSASFIF